MTIAHVLLIFVNNYLGLMIGTILTGVSYGGEVKQLFVLFEILSACYPKAQFAVVPIILNRYFGDKHYGKNLGLQSTSASHPVFVAEHS